MKTPRQIIGEHPFFAGLPPDQLDLLASKGRETTFKSGEILFREGEPANRFFLIDTGKINLEAHQPGQGNVLVQDLGPGEMLGWSWLFPPFVWHFQARAVQPTRGVVFDAAHLLATSESNPKFGYELMKRVAQVVIQRLQAVRKRLLLKQRLETAVAG